MLIVSLWKSISFMDNHCRNNNIISIILNAIFFSSNNICFVNRIFENMEWLHLFQRHSVGGGIVRCVSSFTVQSKDYNGPL